MKTDVKYPPIYPEGYFDRKEWDETIPDEGINKEKWSYVIYNPDGSITFTTLKPVRVNVRHFEHIKL